MKIRVLYTRGADTYDLLWLEHKGTDLYFGNPAEDAKWSYHASGQLHLKAEGEKSEQHWRTPLHMVNDPSPLLTGSFVNFPPYAAVPPGMRPAESGPSGATLLIDGRTLPDFATISFHIGLLSSASPVGLYAAASMEENIHQMLVATACEPWVFLALSWEPEVNPTPFHIATFELADHPGHMFGFCPREGTWEGFRLGLMESEWQTAKPRVGYGTIQRGPKKWFDDEAGISKVIDPEGGEWTFRECRSRASPKRMYFAYFESLPSEIVFGPPHGGWAYCPITSADALDEATDPPPHSDGPVPIFEGAVILNSPEQDPLRIQALLKSLYPRLATEIGTKDPPLVAFASPDPIIQQEMTDALRVAGFDVYTIGKDPIHWYRGLAATRSNKILQEPGASA